MWCLSWIWRARLIIVQEVEWWFSQHHIHHLQMDNLLHTRPASRITSLAIAWQKVTVYVGTVSYVGLKGWRIFRIPTFFALTLEPFSGVRLDPRDLKPIIFLLSVRHICCYVFMDRKSIWALGSKRTPENGWRK